ncbi:MFS transporter [Maricaulis maris]|uniref:Putative MFS family arabinose efflux permease n=1 Tax=Maricaulis maris TaxID=74318 RepID=A0A495DKD7_9PROT|nr:MFS transporter [Maricaulis maris]RKR03080.1 putative MFS family arabinose efflux permease [Maricaulis maris]
MTNPLTDPRFANNRSLIASICCAAVCGIVFGLSMPLVSLRLEGMTSSGLIVGLNGAAAAFSTLVMAPIVPRLLSLVPGRVLIVVSLLCAGALHALFPVFETVPAWFVLRFVMGSFMTVVFVVSETWINQIATPMRRATILGVYGTVLSGGFGVGAFLFGQLGTSGDAGFYAGGLIFLIGALPIILLQGPAAQAPGKDEASPTAILNAARLAPAAIGAALAFGALETVLFSMAPVYGDRLLLSDAGISMVAMAAAAGALAFQIPLGWIADKTDRREALKWIATTAAITPLAIWAVGDYLPGMMLLFFIQAGVASGLYTVGLALVGERFSGGAIAAANAAFIFAYGTGSLFGPPASGIAMDGLGPHGLMIVMAMIAAIYAALVWVRAAPTDADS